MRARVCAYVRVRVIACVLACVRACALTDHCNAGYAWAHRGQRRLRQPRPHALHCGSRAAPLVHAGVHTTPKITTAFLHKPLDLQVHDDIMDRGTMRRGFPTLSVALARAKLQVCVTCDV